MMTTYDESRVFSMQNAFLQSILDPAHYLSDIPDDEMRLHTKRQETVTYNLPATTDSGMIVIWPSNPTYVIGAHYHLKDGKWVFDQMLKTAQNLSKAYNYGRKISQLVTIRSSTLPAGVYALNGTMNAVSYSGCLSEIEPLSYDSILASTTNLLDKKGNVLIGTGLAVLTLPAKFDLPYVRLDDPSPSATGNVVTITNGGADLRYTLDIPDGYQTLPPNTTQQTLFQATFNIDAIDTVTVEMPSNTELIDITNPQIACNLLDINGETLYRQVYIAPNWGEYSLLTYFFSFDAIRQPVCGVHIQYIGDTGANPKIGFDNGTIVASVTNSNGLGYTSPTVIVSYQGVSPGSMITVAGVSNYELVPNPELQKNLELTYGEYKPHDLTYVKLLLANREKFGIRSIYDMGEYNALLSKFEPLTDYSVSAESFDFGSLLKTIKDIAVPVASALIPGAAPVISGLNSLLGGASASGLALGKSASGRPRTYRPLGLSMDKCVNMMTGPMPTPSSSKEMILDFSDAGVALFPVILTMRGQVLSSEPTIVYAAMTLTEKLKNQIPELSSYPNYYVGEHRIYGCPDTPEMNIIYGPIRQNLISTDMFMTPVFQLSNNKLTTITNPPVIQGSSHQLALCVASQMLRMGRVGKVPSALFTGGVCDTFVKSVLGTELKRALAKSSGLNLIGNSRGVDIRVSSVKDPLLTRYELLTNLAMPSASLDLDSVIALAVDHKALTLQKYIKKFWDLPRLTEEYSETYPLVANSSDWIMTMEPEEDDLEVADLMTFSPPQSPTHFQTGTSAFAPPLPPRTRAFTSLEQPLTHNVRKPRVTNPFDPDYEPEILPDPAQSLSQDKDLQNIQQWDAYLSQVPEILSFGDLTKIGFGIWETCHNVIAPQLATMGRAGKLEEIFINNRMPQKISEELKETQKHDKLQRSAEQVYNNNRQIQQLCQMDDYVDLVMSKGTTLSASDVAVLLGTVAPNKNVTSLTNIYNSNAKLAQVASLEDVITQFAHMEPIPQINVIYQHFLERAPKTPLVSGASPRAGNLIKSLSNMYNNNVKIQQVVSLDDFIGHFVTKGHVPTPQEALNVFSISQPEHASVNKRSIDPVDVRQIARKYQPIFHQLRINPDQVGAFISQKFGSRTPSDNEVKAYLRSNLPGDIGVLFRELLKPGPEERVQTTTTFTTQATNNIDKLVKSARATYANNTKLRQLWDEREFVERVLQAGRMPTPEELKAMIPKDQLIAEQPKRKNDEQLSRSAANMYNNNSGLQKRFTLEEFTKIVIERGRLPTGQENRDLISSSKGNALENMYRSNKKLSGVMTLDNFKALVGDRPVTTQLVVDILARRDLSKQPTTTATLPAKPRSYVSYLGLMGQNPPAGLDREIMRMVDAVYDSNGGKGPNGEQNKDLVSRIKELVSRRITPQVGGRYPTQPTLGAVATIRSSGATNRLDRMKALRNEPLV